ncbi:MULTISPECIES: hypothetical protein [Streptomyces]|uniref:hypothetical protein n=1 Tax=Streptomyces TaxID=1883 RepID=UPI000A4481EA|nr:hypothetical protein [Streptomyces griseus]
MGGWWRKKSAPERDVPVTGAPEFLAGSVRGTLPAHLDGPGGRRAAALVVHDDGVVLTVGDVCRTYVWSEVAHLWHANDMDGEAADGLMITKWLHELLLEFTDGTVVNILLADPPVVTPESAFRAGRLASSPPSVIAPLMQRVIAPVTELHLARAKAALEAGGQVEFGPLTARADGLHHGVKKIPWHAITSCRYGFVLFHEDEDELGAMLRMEYAVDGGAHGFPFAWLRIPALDVPDLDALVRLADDNRP